MFALLVRILLLPRAFRRGRGWLMLALIVVGLLLLPKTLPECPCVSPSGDTATRKLRAAGPAFDRPGVLW